jgi:hypothetical protein
LLSSLNRNLAIEKTPKAGANQRLKKKLNFNSKTQAKSNGKHLGVFGFGVFGCL